MYTYYTLLLFAAAFIELLAAVTAWQKRNVAGGPALTLLLVSIGIWCFFSALETTSLTDSDRYLWSSLSYIGLVNAPPLALVFALQYSDARLRPTLLMCLVIWSVPTASVALAFTNNFHHLIWTGITPGVVPGTNTAIYHHGPWYLVMMIWFFALSIFASYHLLRTAVRAARLYVLQAVVFVTFIVLPWLGFLFYLIPGSPTAGLDTTSLGFAVGAVLMIGSLSRLRFMDLVPQVRATLVEHMQEGFLVVDNLDRVIDVNPTARRLLRVESPTVGSQLTATFPMLKDVHMLDTSTRLLSPFPGDDVSIELSVSPLVSRTGRRTGRLFLLRDVSERRRAELEREKLIADLQDALSRVKRLSGLLPICASCKKIRDDSGYWQQVETYMASHSEVEFSHGLCPECAAKLYPEAFSKG